MKSFNSEHVSVSLKEGCGDFECEIKDLCTNSFACDKKCMDDMCSICKNRSKPGKPCPIEDWACGLVDPGYHDRMLVKNAEGTLKEFFDKLSNGWAFSMEAGDEFLYFTRVWFGNAVLIYGASSSLDISRRHPDSSLILTAIISNGTIYIVDKWAICHIVGDYIEDMSFLPDNFTYFYHVKIEKEEYLEKVLLKEFMESLDVPDDYDTGIDIHREARRLKLGGEERPYRNLGFLNLLNIPDDIFIQSLCGLKDIDEWAQATMEEHRGICVHQKAYESQIRDAMADPSIAEKWEIDMAESLTRSDNKTVGVDFSVNGVEYSERMLLKNILVCLSEDLQFDPNDFISRPKGEKAIATLNPYSKRSKKYHPLTCADITKIYAHREAIYEAPTVQ